MYGLINCYFEDDALFVLGIRVATEESYLLYFNYVFLLVFWLKLCTGYDRDKYYIVQVR